MGERYIMEKTRKFLSRDEWAKLIGTNEGGAIGLPEIPPLYKFSPTEVIERDVDVNTGMHDLEFVISTPAIDREHDVIKVDGWHLENFEKNPVVLWAHQYSTPPVARAPSVYQEGDQLRGVARFTPADVNPFGHMVYQMTRGGFLNATSVGFQPMKYVWNDEHGGYDFEEQDLLEFSIVPVPANPEALLAASAEGIDTSPLREWAEKILDNDADSDRVALWLPRAFIETIHQSVGRVAATHDGTGTPEPEDVEKDAEGVEPPTPELSEVASVFRKTEDENNDREEMLMKEAIKALTEVIAELRDEVKGLPEKVAASVEEKIVKTIPDDPEEGIEKDDGEDLDDEDVAAIVKAATEEITLAQTGALPE